MDFKNVLIAIVLSTIVLVAWGTFFEAPIVEQQTSEKQIVENQDLSSPSIDETEKEIKNEITRNDVINNTKRIKVENKNIKGSISLQGAIIDDIIFKNYKETLNSKNKSTLAKITLSMLQLAYTYIMIQVKPLIYVKKLQKVKKKAKPNKRSF